MLFYSKTHFKNIKNNLKLEVYLSNINTSFACMFAMFFYRFFYFSLPLQIKKNNKKIMLKLFYLRLALRINRLLRSLLRSSHKLDTIMCKFKLIACRIFLLIAYASNQKNTNTYHIISTKNFVEINVLLMLLDL